MALLIFPGGLFVIVGSLAYEYADRKLVARFQNRVGPRWFQPLADLVKLLVKEEIVPAGVNRGLFIGLPVAALAASLTAALYVPMAGLAPTWGFRGDLVVTVYLLMMMTLCIGLAGANTHGPLLPRRLHARPHAAFLLRGAVPAGPAGAGHRRGDLAHLRGQRVRAGAACG